MVTVQWNLNDPMASYQEMFVVYPGQCAQPSDGREVTGAAPATGLPVRGPQPRSG